jgi:endonuclease/exonuclease/phosphatase family metal-dependent hydrolase
MNEKMNGKMKVGICVLFLLGVFSIANAKKAVLHPIDVMTFNIRLDSQSDSLNNWQCRKDNVVRMLNYYAPGLIGMQEVLKNQLDDLKKGLPDYVQIGVGRADGKEKGEYSALFISKDRFEIIKQGTYGLSQTPEIIGVKGWDAACERIVTWAVLKDKFSGKAFAVFNTHFDHIGQIARHESARLLLSKAKELAPSLPTIITGDFNGTPDSDPITYIVGAGWKDSRTVAPIVYGPDWTFHDYGRVPVKERPLIDYVFVNKGFGVSKYRVIGDKIENQPYLSDHNPVLVQLGFDD